MDHRKGQIIGFSGLTISLVVILISCLARFAFDGLADLLLVVVRFSLLISLPFGLYGAFHLSMGADEEIRNYFYGKNED